MQEKRQKRGSRGIALLLSLLLIISLIPISAVKANAVDYTSHDISSGALTISSGNYHITGKTTTKNNTITVNGGTHTIKLDSVDIQIQNVPITLKNNADVTLVLSGSSTLKNTLSTGASKGAIEVPQGCTLTIMEDTDGGVLTASASNGPNTAVIGGGNNSNPSGTIVIKSGSLTVTREKGAGAVIGGGSKQPGTVTVEGGQLSLSTSTTGAALGSGNSATSNSTVTISGGTIIATKGKDDATGSGIGSYSNATSYATVTITGGSISAPYVTNPKNANGTSVYLTTITVAGQANAAVSGIQYNGKNYGDTDVYTDADGKLYFWFPTADTEVTFNIGETAYTASGTVTTDNETAFVATQGGGNTSPKDAAKRDAENAFADLKSMLDNGVLKEGTSVTAFLGAVQTAEDAVEAAIAESIGWTMDEIADETNGFAGYADYQTALSLKATAISKKDAAVNAFNSIEGETYEAVKDKLALAETAVTNAKSFGWADTEIKTWDNYNEKYAPAHKLGTKEITIAAFSAIPAYDGSNDDAIRTAVNTADEAIAEAADAEWTDTEIKSWANYARYDAAKKIIQHLPSFPTVTLTVMGLPEDEDSSERFFIEPTNYSVLEGSSVAEVLTAALDKAGISYDYTGTTTAGGDFFIRTVGDQTNSGAQGWMYMVNTNAYIAYGMNNYAVQNEDNILVYYSTKGYNGGSGDSNVGNPYMTPYGYHGSFQAQKNAANAKETVDLKSSGAVQILEKDWAQISAELTSIRTCLGNISLPAVGDNGSMVVWSSGNKDIISDGGVVTLPAQTTKVTLTATLYFSDQFITRTVEIPVGTAGGLNKVTVKIETADGSLNTLISELGGNDGSVTIELNGLTAIPVTGLSYSGCGENTVMAAHALVKAIGNNTNPPEIADGDKNTAHIQQLLGWPTRGEYDANGAQWVLRICDKDGHEVFSGDYRDNLLASLASEDTVTYRFVAGTKILQELYNTVSTVSAATYSASTYSAFKTAYDAAAAVLEKDVLALTQSEVDTAFTALKKAYDELAFEVDYFGGGDESVHHSVLSWITKYPQWLYHTSTQSSGRDGFIALALNNMLTEDFVAEAMKTGNHVLWDTLVNTAYPPIPEQAICAIGLTIADLDMTYFYTPTNLIGFEEWDYALTYIMSGKASIERTTTRRAGRLNVLNVLPYPDYQNLEDRKVTTDLTRAVLLEQLLADQTDEGRWPSNSDDGVTKNAATMYAMEALAPYYWGEIALPDTISREAIETAVAKGLPALTSDIMLGQFAPDEASFYSRDGYRLLNVLLRYGVNINDPSVVRFPCSGDVGVIDWILKTYLSDDGTHFRRISEEKFWLETDNGDLTSTGLMNIIRLNGKLGLTMTLYKQCLDETTGEFKTSPNTHATYFQNKPYQNQAEKQALELKFYHARYDTLGLNHYNYGWKNGTMSYGNVKGTVAQYYDKLNDYTAESGQALVDALDQAYDVLVHLSSTKEQIAAAEAALDAALVGLIPNTPEGAVIQQIKALTDISPDKAMATEVAAARIAYEALTAEQKALVTNYEDLVAAEHWSAIAVGYNAETTIGDYLTNIGNSYAASATTTEDDWKVVDMAIAGRTGDLLADEAAIQSFVTDSIGRIDPATMTDYERVLIAVTAAGVDGADLTKYCSFTDSASNEVTSLVDCIVNFDGDIVVNSMVWGLVALDSGDYEVPAGATWTRAAMIDQLISYQFNTGAWPINPGDTTESVDTTAMAIVALAPYTDQAAVKTAVDKATAYLEGLQTTSGTGAFQFGSTDNSNSTAMVILARIATGENPRAAYPNSYNPVTALITKFGLSDKSAFGYTDNTSANGLGTEQSFRALAAYHALAYDHSTAIYHFGAPTLTGPWTSTATSVKLNKTYTTLTVGATETLTATVKPEGSAVTWSSTAPAVASVENGVVTAKKAGTATIKAKLADGKTASCEVTVRDDSTKITVTFALLGDTAHGSGGEIHTLKTGNGSLTTWISAAEVSVPTDSTVRELLEKVLTEHEYTWDNPTGDYVKAITNTDLGIELREKGNGINSGWMYTLNGVHVALGIDNKKLADGDTVVFHYTDDYTKESEVGGALVVDSLTLNKATLELASGQSEQLTATVDPFGAPVTWTSSDAAVATVDDGYVTAVAAGSAIITASSGDKSAKCTVYVDGYDAVAGVKAEIAALPDTVTAANKSTVETAKTHYDALTAAQKNLLTTEETNKLLKAVNTLTVLDAMAAVADTKDFTSVEANTQTAVKTALLALNDTISNVTFTAFTAATDGAAASPNGTNGSYSATLTFTVGTGGQMASGTKTVTGTITAAQYVKSSDAGVKTIKVNGVTARGTGTAYTATLPYGSDIATATFAITPADHATASVPATSDGGTTWTFTVTAEDGTTKQDYTVTLTVSNVNVIAAEATAYSVTNDVEPTQVKPTEVSGLIEAINVDGLELAGQNSVTVWVEVTAQEKNGDDIAVSIVPMYAVEGGDPTQIPAAAIIGDIGLTLPIPATAHARVQSGNTYLAAEGSNGGIAFTVSAAGTYTLIPDARIATVTYHLNSGTATGLTDGQQIVYFREDAGNALPAPERNGYALKGWYGDNGGSGAAYATVSEGLPEDLYAVWQSSDVGAAVTVGGTQADKNGNVFSVSLPYGTAYPTAADIVITPAEGASATNPTSSDGGASWTFTVTAEDGTQQGYTLQVTISAQTAAQALAEDKAAVEAADWTVKQATANNETALKSFVEGKLAEMQLGADYAVAVTSVTPAAVGTADNANGTNGKYSFTITLTLSGESATATVSNAVITAAAYVAPQETPSYVEALNKVLPYVKGKVTNPNVASTYGEWAVFALNRGGAATEEWNNLYLSNLRTYVDQYDGQLHHDDLPYTEYSRIVLALTSMGVDATQFQTDTKTYDLVTPLLDKQSNGKYWAEYQGNNGTTFALLALDSHNYLSNAEGNAARAAWIASLKANQLASGAWSISGSAASIDVTASAIYALAPYYLDSAKLNALGGSVTYAELKTMIDNALAFLSEAQNDDGGYGSVEADVWVIIALASLNRDADKDSKFVKNGKSLLADMLSYFDKSIGGFMTSGVVNQMSSEQGAYGLVAYDRYKKGSKALYDMSDVAFPNPEEPTVAVTGVTLDQTTASVEEGKTVTLTATVVPADATDKVVTWSSGDLTIATVSNGIVTGVKEGSTTITATAGGKSASCAVTVTAASGGTGGGGGGTSSGDKITVTFRLIGAEKASKSVDLGETAYLPDYVTWVSTVSYELDKGATVYDLWTAATSDAGIRSVGAENDYVRTVYAPDDLGGYALSEMSNGNRSGWMYTVNGRHPSFGLTNWELYDGDTVIWHYVNDYSYEVADWGNLGGTTWAALGDGTYYNRWLMAPDRYGAKGGGLTESAGGDKKDDKKTDEQTETVVDGATVTVTAEVTEGEAKAAITEDTVAEALKDAESAEVLTVKVDTEDADSVELALDADAVKAAAEANVDLHVETEVGTIKVDSNTLNELADSGKDIAVTVTANDDGTTTLNVTVDGESVDAKVKVELPAADEGQVLVIVNADGTETVVKKSLVEDGKAYAEIPAGATVKVVEGESIEFGDVADSAWYAEAVEFVASHELFQGTDKGFEPEMTMNRAMLAMVLYRLEDATATGNSNFPDVSDDAWYAEAVAWASETGIVNGTGKGFEPNAPVTREQIATMLYRYANVIGLDTGTRGELSSFPDGSETSGWAQDAMAWAVSVGLFQGDDTGALNPKGDATRAQVATLFERMIGLIVK